MDTSLVSQVSNASSSLIPAIILFLTLIVYCGLLIVSKKTLSFTKNQTSYDLYFSNYKLFDELARRHTDVIVEGDLFGDEIKNFENLTFLTMGIYYEGILKNYPIITNRDKYKVTFKRFNSKLQSFIDILYEEVIRIKKDDGLNLKQKSSLLNLYKNFLLLDYIKISELLELCSNENILTPTEFPNYLRCNTKDEIVFDVKEFLKLFFEISK